MNYYHIIYNSSQRTQDGSAGLGVRTYTQGMPKEYLNLLDENGFFNYSSGSLNQPSPKSLMEDGKLILNYPATYRFTKLFSSETGKDIYVLSRTVSVGFDYPYYVKFEAARVDNFVSDIYLFEEYPSIEAFEILYENPGRESAGFIPRNRVPSPENDEMRALSLGEMALLEPEGKSFACQELKQVSEGSLELLFAYIESCRLHLPLLVKCAAEDAPVLMADLLHLLPESKQKDLFFYTNYQLEGLKEGYGIFFVNEHYKYDFESDGQFFVYDAVQNAKISTDEAFAYREEWMRLLVNGKTDEYFKQLNWVWSPAFDLVRGKSIATKQVMYDYLEDPKSFNFNHVFHGDEELLTTLKNFFAKDKKNQQLFDKQLIGYLASDKIQGNDLVVLLKYVKKLDTMGFELEDVVSHSKNAVTGKLLAAPEVLKTAVERLGVEYLGRFLVKEELFKKNDILDSEVLRDNWAELYKYFYSDEEQKDHVGILLKMFGLNLQDSVVDTVIKGFGVDNLQLCGYYAEVAKRNPSEIDRPYKRIKDVLEQLERMRLELPKATIADNIDAFVFKPLMNDPERPNGLESCRELMHLLSGKFDDQNAESLIARALKINTKQTASLLFKEGWRFVKDRNVDAVVRLIMDRLNPELPEILVKAEGHPLKVRILAEYFKKKGENKKAIERLRKDGRLKLSDIEFDELLSKVFPSSATGAGNDSNGSGKSFMDRMKGFIVPGAIILLAVLFLIMRHPKQDQTRYKLESYSPSDTTVEVKGYFQFTSDTIVPKGTKAGDIFVDTIGGGEKFYRAVVLQQLEEQQPEEQQPEEQQPEEQQPEEQQPEEQQPEEQQ